MDPDFSLLIKDDSKLIVLVVASLVFLIVLAALVIVYIALEARRISRRDISKWRRPVPKPYPFPDSKYGARRESEKKITNYPQPNIIDRTSIPV